MEIKDNIIKVEKINWSEIQPIQSSKFKEITDLDSLKASIKNEGFSVPFIVWENNGVIYSIDGFHRKLALEQFEQEGIEVPEKLDAVFISAKNMKDAAIKLIALQPKAAKITQQGFEEFKTSFEIIDSEVEEYNIETINIIDDEEILIEGEGEKPSVSIMKIVFASSEQLQGAEIDIQELIDRKYNGSYFTIISK